MGKRCLVFAVFSLVACANTDTAKNDSTGRPRPTAITPDNLSGTFSVQVKAQGADSVIARLTCVQRAAANDSRCVNSAAPKDTVIYGLAVSGDSVMWTSMSHAAPTLPTNPQVVDHLVGRLYDSKWEGTGVTVLASKTDSVVLRTRWEATKAR